MNMHEEPLVSVVTPVYNGGAFLEECIVSVLKQTYRNYEYIIVNNCSTDQTLEIATNYAKRDNRIRVHSNNEFVAVIENHNIAFRLISSNSKYCKVVCADDLLFPECIAQMVGVAEANPSVGIVNSYQVSGSGSNWRQWRVTCAEFPYPSTVISGREVCRSHLLGGPYVFGAPSSILYRSDLIKRQNSFYPNSTPHADTSACYKYLQNSDFGFVHQVLSYDRVHDNRQTANSENLNAYFSSKIGDLLEYGSFYLSEGEADRRLEELFDDYYKFFAVSAVNFRSAGFWRYHRERLKELGRPFDNFRFGKALLLKILDLLLNPKSTVEKLLKRAHAHQT